jgi:transcriptional regulator with XRE-family HTH domain
MNQRSSWSILLSLARESVGLSQLRLAELSGVSLGSVKAYEQGRRHASRNHLSAMLVAMRVSFRVRNEVLEAAGYAPDDQGEAVDPGKRRRMVELSQAVAEISEYRWPAYVANENGEILGANLAGMKLWRIQPHGGFFQLGDPAICAATHPEIAPRIVNWDEAVGQQIAHFKSSVLGEESLQEPSPYFERVIDLLERGDSAYVERFLQLWERTLPAYPTHHRWPYNVAWEEPEFGRMRFKCFAWTVNEVDGLDIDDWIPADAETWLVLDRFVGRSRD